MCTCGLVNCTEMRERDFGGKSALYSGCIALISVLVWQCGVVRVGAWTGGPRLMYDTDFLVSAKGKENCSHRSRNDI